MTECNFCGEQIKPKEEATMITCKDRRSGETVHSHTDCWWECDGYRTHARVKAVEK